MKKSNVLNIIIMILAIVLVIAYGFEMDTKPMTAYICGCCWSSVATLRFAQILLNWFDKDAE